MSFKNKKIFLLLAIIIIAVFFRFWKLDSAPPGLYPDIAMNGINAINAIDNHDYKVFYQENNGREGLFMNLIAFSFKIFGIHFWSLRIAGAIAGVLTVIGIYFLTKELLSEHKSKINIALLATFFTAVSFWHVNFSRMGFRAVLVPFVMVWCFYFLIKWWNNIKNQNGNAKFKIFHHVLPIFAGIFFGLGFHTYIAFRFVPFMVIILAFSQLIYLIKNKYYKNIFQWLIGYIIFSIAAILVMLPLILYFYHNPQDFMGRAAQVSIFEQPKPLIALGESLIKTIAMLNFYGDPNWRHNYSGSPLLYWPVGIFFVIGIALSIKQIFKSQCKTLNAKYNILLAWFVLILAPSYLTAEGLPHALRSIGAIPPVMIWAGIGAWRLYQTILNLESKILKKTQIVQLEIQNLNLVLKVAGCIILTLITFHEFKKYFYDWAQNPEVRGAFSQNLVDVGNFVKNLNPFANIYVIVNEGGAIVEDVPVSAQTVKFIYTMNKWPAAQPKINYIVPEKIFDIKTSSNIETIIIPEHYDEKVFKELQAKFKNGIIKKQENITYFVIN